MEKTRHEVLTNKFGIHFFELKKIGKHPDKNNHMQLWLQLINAETEEELDMLENTNVQEINQAIVVLRKLNADEKMRYLAEMREKSLHDEVSALEGAKEEGIAEGIAQGIQKGIAQGIEKGEKRKEDELIEKMRKSGLSDEMINNILNAK